MCKDVLVKGLIICGSFAAGIAVGSYVTKVKMVKNIDDMINAAMNEKTQEETEEAVDECADENDIKEEKSKNVVVRTTQSVRSYVLKKYTQIRDYFFAPIPACKDGDAMAKERDQYEEMVKDLYSDTSATNYDEADLHTYKRRSPSKPSDIYEEEANDIVEEDDESAVDVEEYYQNPEKEPYIIDNYEYNDLLFNGNVESVELTLLASGQLIDISSGDAVTVDPFEWVGEEAYDACDDADPYIKVYNPKHNVIVDLMFDGRKYSEFLDENPQWRRGEEY